MVGKPGSKHSDGVIDASVDQSRAETLPPLREPSLNGSNRKTELDGGLFVGQSFEMAEDDRRPESIGKAVELGVDLPYGNSPRFLIDEPRFHFASSTLEFAPAGRFGPGFGRDAKRNAEKPARQGIDLPDRAAPLGQD
jgi:hypothetical protein